MTKLPSVFDSTNVQSSLVTNESNFVTPSVIYDLTVPIRSKIFNFDNLVSDLNVDQFLDDVTILPCNCNEAVFANEDHGQ